MNSQPIIEYLKELISKQLSTKVSSLELTPVGGGSINDTCRVTIGGHTKFFLKTNSSAKFPGLFEKERTGLEFLRRQNCIRVPHVIICEPVDKYQLLLLEWIESGIRNENFWTKFGEQMAQLHTISHGHFGLAEDNYMGSLPQKNDLKKTWLEFFISCRIQPQLELANSQNLLEKSHRDRFETLYGKLDNIFDIEPPSLVHGDLWSGNFMCDNKALPVLIDPAIYFGNRNMDLAMTTLFSGFDGSFYESYNYHYPFSANYREQWEICNLYPLLIHLNLFGKGYLPDIDGTLKRFS